MIVPVNKRLPILCQQQSNRWVFMSVWLTWKGCVTNLFRSDISMACNWFLSGDISMEERQNRHRGMFVQGRDFCTTDSSHNGICVCWIHLNISWGMIELQAQTSNHVASLVSECCNNFLVIILNCISQQFEKVVECLWNREVFWIVLISKCTSCHCSPLSESGFIMAPSYEMQIHRYTSEHLEIQESACLTTLFALWKVYAK